MRNLELIWPIGHRDLSWELSKQKHQMATCSLEPQLVAPALQAQSPPASSAPSSPVCLWDSIVDRQRRSFINTRKEWECLRSVIEHFYCIIINIIKNFKNNRLCWWSCQCLVLEKKLIYLWIISIVRKEAHIPQSNYCVYLVSPPRLSFFLSFSF